MNRFLALSLFVSIGLPGAAFAQGNDIYLFDMEDGYRLVTQVTDRAGYDSQPAFTLDSGAVLFSSDRAGLVDIFRFEIDSGQTDNLTNTPDTNEYSGQPWGEDRFSFVLQEGNPYQNVWHRAWDGGAATRVLTSFIPVGYYAHNAKGVLFWARYASSLFFEPAGAQISADLGESLFVTGNAGFTVAVIPGTDNFSFVHKDSGWGWVIKTFDPDTGAVAALVPITSGNEDYCWTPDGTLLNAAGTQMLQFRPGADERWQPLAMLDAPGLNKIGRCAVSPDGRYLAIVNERAE